MAEAGGEGGVLGDWEVVMVSSRTRGGCDGAGQRGSNIFMCFVCVPVRVLVMCTSRC